MREIGETVYRIVRELMDHKVTLIATDQSVHAVKAASSTVPTVFVLGADPVGLGLVQSLNRPGGNITGIVLFLPASPSGRAWRIKRRCSRFSKQSGGPNRVGAGEGGGRRHRPATRRSRGHSRQRDRPGVHEIRKTSVNAVLVGSGPFFRSHKQQIVELAARYSLPASYSLREYVEAGGLMSYGTSITNSCREAGLYAARILKGEKPSELPVIQSTKFELALNLKTSKALGLSFPQAVLLAADEVIE